MRTFLLLLGTTVLVIALWFSSTLRGETAFRTSPTTKVSQHKERPLSLLKQAPKASPSSRPAKRAKATKHVQPRGATKPAKRAKAKDCDTGCAAVKGTTPKLSQERFQALVQAFAGEKLVSGAKALETLLFHGPVAKNLLETQALPPLSTGHLSFLKRELKRTHISLSFRIKDEHGVIRAAFQQKIKIGGHFHVEAQSINGIQRPSFGGKSKRVGLHHIWVRI